MASSMKGNTMNIITDIYLILGTANKYVKVCTQDITEDFDNRLDETRPVHSADGFKWVCYELAEEFRMRWEDKHDLGGRTFARTRIAM